MCVQGQAVFVYVGERIEQPGQREERIIMKVVSWDSRMLWGRNAAKEGKGGGVGGIFVPALKLLWGVETGERVHGKGELSSGQNLFGWADLCCQPLGGLGGFGGGLKSHNPEAEGAGTTARGASAKIILQDDEYASLLKDLEEGGECFPREVARQSLIMENIKVNGGDKRGISMLPLKHT